MEFDVHLGSRPDTFSARAYTIRDIIFRRLAQRSENATVILGHDQEQVIEITLPELRSLIIHIAGIIKEKGFKKGDTIFLASFYSTNELPNAILFSAFACLGIRIFIPIYPEVKEFEYWEKLTNFKAVIIPYKEILQQKGHEREKEVVRSLDSLCRQHNLEFLDASEDFTISSLIKKVKEEKDFPVNETILPDDLLPEDEAVIFTTSGTSGRSKLLVYNQGSFSLSCQSWQQADLFNPGFCGNPGFTPLFTHTIGIRNFINALWSGHPACILVVDWFLHKPEMARYLLLQMRPGHIVGGPAMFNMLIEFFRQYPELKLELRETLRTLISIGAPYNIVTARQIKTALDLDLLNAFGTTETQMVFLNRNTKRPGYHAENLGEPMPGVSIGLNETEERDIYELYVRSPYRANRVLGEAVNLEYFATGDLVTYGDEGSLAFSARKGTDFIKDDFGVKLPVAILKEYYPWLFAISDYIEWIPLDNKPGLAALIFLNSSFGNYGKKEISEWIKNRNELLQLTTQPFEFTHRHLERFSIETSQVPLTRKGTVSKKEIAQAYEELISNLRNPYVEEKQIESVAANEKSLLYKFSNPRMAELLETLKMDVEFEKGMQDTLFFQRDGKWESVLDLVGGFGSGLLGHNHPKIKNVIRQFLDSGRPAINSQGSLYHYPSLLARELNKIFSESTGKYFKVQFGNTGSEAIEIALHHAWYEWWVKMEKKRDEQLQLFGSIKEVNAAAIWDQNMKRIAETPAALMVINNCFHGYTSGARSLLNNKKQRYYFSGLLRPIPLHINDQDANWKEQIESFKSTQSIVLNYIVKENEKYVAKPERVSNIIASVMEPVRGEGGIYETRFEVADHLSQQDFPLIADEIQCGLGRTGSLPAYKKASYYLLGKSLGGGFEKISAVLIDDKRFKNSFPQYYTSTFANGEMAACASLAALDTIMNEDVAGTALKKGVIFTNKLKAIAEKYPDIIESVQGKGLMLGVHFNKQVGQRNTLLRVLCENELLGYLIAGWLFHNKKIRVLPSLSKPDSIRIEPSVYISEESMDCFCEALNELCMLCRSGAMYDLLKFLMNDDPYLDKKKINFDAKFPCEVEVPAPGALKVGFVGNFTIPPKELMLIEPDLQKASETGLRILFNKMQTMLEGKPMRLFSKNLMNGKIHFTFYILPFDTAHLEIIHRWGKKRWYIARIQEAVNRLSAEGATHISLGAHTSILSGNGIYLAEPGNVKILTGNTLTVSSCLYHVERYFDKLIRKKSGAVTIAIAGANGNIGSGLAGCLTGDKYASSKILLVGNNLKKLESMRRKIFDPGHCVECSIDLFRLQEADIIVSCTNTNDPLIFPHHIHADKKVFIIDIAVPGSVSEDAKQLNNVQFCREASTLFLPDDPDFIISTHTPVGKIFCCAAEVILAALYHVQLPLKGHVNPESIKAMMDLAILERLFNKKEYATAV